VRSRKRPLQYVLLAAIDAHIAVSNLDVDVDRRPGCTRGRDNGLIDSEAAVTVP
jgi:hypothetical protein